VEYAVLKGLSAYRADKAVHVPSLIESVHCILNKETLLQNDGKFAYPNDLLAAFRTCVRNVTFKTGTTKHNLIF